MKRKSHAENEFVISAALGHNNPGSLVAARSPRSLYENVIGYIELLSTMYLKDNTVQYKQKN